MARSGTIKKNKILSGMFSSHHGLKWKNKFVGPIASGTRWYQFPTEFWHLHQFVTIKVFFSLTI